ncbi:MAG: hypothetical protein WCX32_02555 [Clostridia bacterium]|nr:hypothetical protein [Clostridia bacterium]
MVDYEIKKETVPALKSMVENAENVAVIILLCNNPAFKISGKPYNLELCGKKMYEWVVLAVGQAKTTIVPCEITDDLISLVKPYLTNCKYTAVLYSDTPLLSKKTFLEIIEYVSIKQLNVCKLSRGYIFNTTYLKSTDKIYAPQTHYFEEEDFLAVYNFKQLAIISDILKNRILNYHMKEGVRFIDPSSTFIDADVLIGSSTVVYSNNHLLGTTQIGENCTLESGNFLVNSLINNNVTLYNSRIENSSIGNNSKINACQITDSDIGVNTIIEKSGFIADSVTGENVYFGTGVKVSNFDGKNKHKTMISDKVFIGAGSTLIAPLKIGLGAFIAAGSTITDDVPEQAFAVARATQKNKNDWRE